MKSKRKNNYTVIGRFKDSQDFAHFVKREMAKKLWKDISKLQKTRFR